jgi:uncharacterized NAD(P)/FAD-binding protein YdhS
LKERVKNIRQGKKFDLNSDDENSDFDDWLNSQEKEEEEEDDDDAPMTWLLDIYRSNIW